MPASTLATMVSQPYRSLTSSTSARLTFFSSASTCTYPFFLTSLFPLEQVRWSENRAMKWWCGDAWIVVGAETMPYHTKVKDCLRLIPVGPHAAACQICRNTISSFCTWRPTLL